MRSRRQPVEAVHDELRALVVLQGGECLSETNTALKTVASRMTLVPEDAHELHALRLAEILDRLFLHVEPEALELLLRAHPDVPHRWPLDHVLCLRYVTLF